MKKILVPTDFSPNAAKAIDYAVQIAKVNQSSIYLMHALDLMDATLNSQMGVREEYNKTLIDEAFKQLEMVRTSIEETEQVLVNTQIYNGAIVDSIQLAAKEHGVDMIIMGTLGISGLKDLLFGSKTAAVIGAATVPVLAIPLEYEWSAPKRFMVAVNKFDEAVHNLNPVFELSRLFDAEVEIAVYTVEKEAAVMEFIEHESGIHRLDNILKGKYRGVKIYPEHLFGERFSETLNEHIREKGIDLLAMLTHKRDMVESIFRRSLTKRMSYHTKVPLLAIPVEEE